MTSILMRVGQICGFRKKPRPNNRKIFVGNKAPPGVDAVVEEKYPSNLIVSSKYTKWNFLPKNLFAQFKRVANFYFLCITLIEVFVDTPVSPVTSALPLITVIAFTAVKQAYEDWLRHKADREVNLRPAQVIRDHKQKKIMAMDIVVGDIVRVEAKEGIPCDMVLLSTENPEGECLITTANLDGETSLKTFNCINDTRELRSVESLSNFNATIECEQPTTDLYKFIGNLNINGGNGNHVARPLGPENVLLRGSRLKNTPYVYGCAIYTGPDTKISLNTKSSRIKFSQVEKFMNRALISFLVVLLIQSVVLTGLKYWNDKLSLNMPSQRWYVPPDHPWTFKKVVEEVLSFMVLCNYIIPISLYVTIEAQKFIGSMFFEWDLDIYDAQMDEPAKANTSDLNEELGQVELMFTDKTGTLTENDMQFRQCSVGGTKYIDVGGMLCVLPDIPGAQPMPVKTLHNDMEALLTVLALCHTVHLEGQEKVGANDYSTTGMEYEYQASSPDEKALVEASRRYGVVYHGLKEDQMVVTFKGQVRKYKQLHILDFDSNRKRMSTIVENEQGEKYLLTKGAEMAVLDRCIVGNIEDMENHVNDYAMLGLRTLVIAHRKFTEEEYAAADQMLCDARMSLVQRDEKLAEAFSEIESKMTLLGATAVEDRLQEGVPETLRALAAAGIQVWVLTGDKEETAVNISYSAGHFSQDVRELRLTNQLNSENCGIVINQLTHILRDAQNLVDREHALIIDGRSLALALHDHRDALQELCEIVSTVLCCRMTPLQKAEVVKLMKTTKRRPVTAAIGDGANDVSMIQEADVGLGIMGKEGRQAVRSSDYAFGRFKFLQKILLVHGRFFYVRLAVLVQYFFYKNIAFIVHQFYYVFFNSYSAQSLFDTLWLTFYNIVFTSLPVLIYGLFEQDMRPSELLSDPRLYRTLRGNARLTLGEFLKWCFLGLWHSVVIFFGTWTIFTYVTYFTQDGKNIDGFNEFGTLIYTTTVIVVNIKLMLEWFYWTPLTVISYLLTAAGFCLLGFLYTSIFLTGFITTSPMYWVLTTVFSNYMVWLLAILLGVTALLPDIFLRTLENTFNPVYQKRLAKRARRRAHHDDVQLRSMCIRGESTSSELSLISNESSLYGMDSPVFHTNRSYAFFYDDKQAQEMHLPHVIHSNGSAFHGRSHAPPRPTKLDLSRVHRPRSVTGTPPGGGSGEKTPLSDIVFM